MHLKYSVYQDTKLLRGATLHLCNILSFQNGNNREYPSHFDSTKQVTALSTILTNGVHYTEGCHTPASISTS